MQIEIPDLDDDLPPPSHTQLANAFAPGLSHRRDGSSSSITQATSGPSFSFPSFTSPNQAASRPFGGQQHQQHQAIHTHPIASLAAASNEIASSHEIRRKASVNGNQLHTSPSSPSLNGAHHPALISRPSLPRKLSVASLRSGHNHKSAHNGDHSRLQRNGSDLFANSIGISQFPSSHNPVPSGAPNGRSPRSRSNTTTTSTTNSAGSAMSDNHAPLEVAIYLIIERFFEECETKLGQLLGKPISTSCEDDVYIPYCMGQGADPSLDATFESLAQVSRKNPCQVINHVMRWKSKQGEGIDDYSIQRALTASGNSANARRVATVLSERKGLALVYILCRALIAIVQGVSREALGEELGSRLEDIVFNSIKNADPYLTARTPNKQANMNMYAYLLGALSNIRFTSVSDRFTAEIEMMYRSALVRDQKDAEARLGYLIRGVQFLKLKVYPPEAFEDTVDFVASFATIFEASRGSVVKTAMAETLGPLLAQVVQTATAEVNHPVWNKAISLIFNKAHSMSDKPSKARYWNSTVPLICAAVGAAPQDFLLARWTEAVEWCSSKLKDKSSRPTMMLGVVQLVWSYLHRVREGASAVNKRLEPILKSAFPPDRKNVYPSEVSLDTFASLIHFILHWQLDYGTDFVLRTLLTGTNDGGEANQGLVAQAGSERIMIGIHGSLRALRSLEQGEDPLYPAGETQNGSRTSLNVLGPGSPGDQSNNFNDGHILKPELLEKPRIKAFVDAIGIKVLQIAAYCDRTLAPYIITDDKYVAPWHDSIAQRAETIDGPTVVKRHGYFAVEYPRHLQPAFDVLQACLQAWPRILTSAASESAALAILFRGLISLDAGVTVEAKLCLRRFLAAGKSFAVTQAYTRFLAKPEFFFRFKPLLQRGLDTKVEGFVKFWVEALSAWCEELRRNSNAEENPDAASSPSFGPEGFKLVSHVEATGLVLLCSRSSYIRRSALDALRITGTARTIIEESGFAMTPRSVSFPRSRSVAGLLDEAETRMFEALNTDDFTSSEKSRSNKWRKHRKLVSGEGLTRLLESDNPADNTLLCYSLSSVFSTTLKHLPDTIAHARTLLYGQLQRVYPLASEAAGVGGRSVVNGNGPNPGWDDRNLYMSWSSLLISVTSITTATDPKSGNLSTSIDTLSLSNQSSTARERNISPGEDLIKTLVPFLTSDQSPFREATMRAMSSIDVSMYPTLLEGLSGLAHHLTSERKMIEAQQDRSARPNGAVKIIRLFSAIGKLHESTTKLLFHPNFNLTERCVDILFRFIRETCLFLRSRQSMEDHTTISIRKSFLVFGERLFRKLGSNVDPELKKQIRKLCPNDLSLDIFNLAEDWSTRTANTFGSNTNLAQSANGPDARLSRANSQSSRVNVPVKGRSSASSSGSNNGDLLLASATMIATLCESVLDVRSASGSQRRTESNGDRPTVSATRLLRWIVALFEKNDLKAHAQARRAFLGAARNTSEPDRLLEATLTICWNESESHTLQQTVFGVMGNALIAESSLKIRDAALLALCLARLSHFDLNARQRAIDLLKVRGMLGTQLDWLSDIEVSLASTFSGDHLAAQFRTCSTIAGFRTVDPTDFILELGSRIVQIDFQKSKLLARLMPTWLAQIQLPSSVPESNSSKVKSLLNVVLLASSKMIETQPDEVRLIWSAFANASANNTPTIISYLVEQTTRRASPAFVKLVRTLLSCMSDGNGMETVAKELLNMIEPAKLLITSETKPTADVSQPSRPFDLDSYFPLLPSRTVFSPMQAAILLLGEAMVLRPLALGDRLPHILHANVVQVDHTNLPFRGQMREGLVRFIGMLRRIQESDTAYDQLAATPAHETPERDSWRTFWEFDDMGSSRRHRKGPPANMELVVSEIASLSSQLLPDFCRNWAKVAVEWAAQCPVRHIACRSLQIVRVLGLPVDPSLLAELLVRLSNTASDPSPDIQLFALEALTTFSACTKVQTVNQALFAQLFWTGVACLETANDLEFLEAIDLLKSVLSPIEAADCLEIEASRPSVWEADGGPIRPLMIKGLRSSQICQASWSLVKALLSVPNSFRVVTWSNGGIALLYAASLPWCLQILETGVMQYEMDEIALKLAQLADSVGMDGLSRVMVSFAKKRFRTKEDFLRQAVNGIREYFLPAFGPDILVVYLGLLCNPLEWLRAKTLAVLKLFVRMIEPNSPEIMDLGYDLLTPLLAVLQTNVSHLALDILAEPMPVKSKSLGGKKSAGDDGVTKKVFGMPDETGWCVPSPQEAMRLTRSRLTDVINTFATSFISETLSRPSVVEFSYEWGHEPDNNVDAQTQSDFAETNESFGDMVSTLHDLSDFFGQDGSGPGSRISSPLNPSTARVAAILSRSLSKRRANRPSLHVRPGGGAAPGAGGQAVRSVASSRPLSMVSSSCSSPSQRKAGGHQHAASLSMDSLDEDIYEEEVEEEDEEVHGGGRASPTGTFCTDDSQSVFAFELEDEQYGNSFSRRKSRQVGMY